MAKLAILLIALAVFGLPVPVCADNPPTLPSRKASVVIPLLNQISPKDSPESVFNQITKILGKSDGGFSGGPTGNFWDDYPYQLDDKTVVDVGTRMSGQVLLRLSVTIQKPDGKPRVLYSFQKT
jgi:hypothetical protein